MRSQGRVPHARKTAHGYVLWLVLVSASIAACAPRIDQERWTPIHRAAKRLATQDRTSFEEYESAIQDLAREIAVLGGQTSTELEEQLLHSYMSVLSAYRDAKIVWEVEKSGWAFKNASWLDSDALLRDTVRSSKQILIGTRQWAESLPDRGYVEFGHDDIELLAERYQLPVETHEFSSGLHWQGIPGDSVQRIWKVAEDRLAQASTLYSQGS